MAFTRHFCFKKFFNEHATVWRTCRELIAPIGYAGSSGSALRVCRSSSVGSALLVHLYRSSFVGSAMPVLLCGSGSSGPALQVQLCRISSPGDPGASDPSACSGSRMNRIKSRSSLRQKSAHLLRDLFSPRRTLKSILSLLVIEWLMNSGQRWEFARIAGRLLGGQAIQWIRWIVSTE